jgi:all-beta uncharacterized protein
MRTRTLLLALALVIALPLSAASRRRVASRCSEIVSPTSISFPASGGHQFVTVTVTAGCPWSPSSTDSWIAAAPATGGVNVDVGANAGANARTGIVHVRGTLVVVTQAANPIPNLISNGGFDSGIAGWSDTFSTGLGSARWSNSGTIVAPPGPSAGSAIITSNDVRKGYQLAQCVNVIGGKTYTVGTKTFVPAGQAPGVTTLAIFEYWVPNCPSLTAPYHGTRNNPGATTTGAWFDNTFSWSSDFATQSVLVVIGAGFTESPPFSAYFDDVFVREKQ